MKQAILSIAVLTAVSSVHAQQAAPDGCTKLNKSYMSSTTDGGLNFTSFRIPTSRNLSLTWGIGALDDSGTLVMHADDALWGSENDGCSWSKIDRSDIPGIFRIAVGPNGTAYAWQDNGGSIYEIHHGDGPGQSWDVTYHKAPTPNMKGFAVDPLDGLHFRTASGSGQIFESFNGGTSWGAIGIPPAHTTSGGYIVAFDPNDLDHAVYGRVSDGGSVTFDGGQTWFPIKGFAAVDGSNVNLFNAEISPADGNTVYAAALDFSYGSDRHIYASTDGGLTFDVVLSDGVNGVYLQNSPLMHADANNADVLRFVFSSSPVFGGTFFYEYDLGADVLTTTQNATLPKVRDFEMSLVTPGKMHVGFDFY